MREGPHAQAIQLTLDGVRIDGDLTIPAGATSVVVFAHGSGSSRYSPRNRRVAAALQEANLATLLIDLLSVEEDEIDRRTGKLRFEIGLLASRVSRALCFLAGQRETAGLPLGLFGASTGAAGALIAAADHPKMVGAVVSRGGRPDLAGEALHRVRAPTLLIVGGNDHQVIDLNRRAAAQLTAEHALEIVPGATHLFEEPGTLEEVARLAAGWFTSYLVAR